MTDTNHDSNENHESPSSYVLPAIAGVTIFAALGFTYYTVSQRRQKELDEMRYRGHDERADLIATFENDDSSRSIASLTYSRFQSLMSSIKAFFGM